MSAGHQHGHSHIHGASADSDQRWLLGALAVIAAFMIGEVLVGITAGSLALLSDAAHMLTDAASIGLALWAIRLAARPATGHMTYGWKRVEILSAQANGLTLLLLAAGLAFEAIHRIVDPPPVAGVPVLIVAVIGIGVNAVASVMISRANRVSLNVEGAFQHIRNDLFAFIATAAAGMIIMFTGFVPADTIATLIVVALMIKAGIELVRASSRIFLEAAPAELDPDRIGTAMAAVGSVVNVHDLHVWEITSGSPALSAHVLVEPGHDCHTLRTTLTQLLSDSYGIQHATLQVDHAQPTVLQVGRPDRTSHCKVPHGPTHDNPIIRL